MNKAFKQENVFGVSNMFISLLKRCYTTLSIIHRRLIIVILLLAIDVVTIVRILLLLGVSSRHIHRLLLCGDWRVD